MTSILMVIVIIVFMMIFETTRFIAIGILIVATGIFLFVKIKDLIYYNKQTKIINKKLKTDLAKFPNSWYKIDGRNVYINKEHIICFDIETTGLERDGSDEILSLTIMNGKKEILYNQLFKPQKNKKWPEAQKINGISPAMVKNKPSFLSEEDEILKIFNNSLLIIGYNIISFDIEFLKVTSPKLNAFFNDSTLFIVDMIHVLSNRLKVSYKCSLNKCCEFYNVSNNDSHSSLGDCTATFSCFTEELINNGRISLANGINVSTMC